MSPFSSCFSKEVRGKGRRGEREEERGCKREKEKKRERGKRERGRDYENLNSTSRT